ncbi:MAG: hypothetical protein RL719_920 [Actinomycetota bacterium]
MRDRTVLLVFLGGALGSISRAFLSSVSSYELAILVINIAGATLLGWVHAAPNFRSEARQAFWATGLCGGFTTLSTVDLMLRYNPSIPNMIYALITLVLGVAGYILAKRVAIARASSESSET